MEDITKLWRQSAAKDRNKQPSCSSKNLDAVHRNDVIPSIQQVKCPFSWVSGLSLQQNNVTWIQEYFQHQSSTWQGWELSEDGNKIGFIPSIAMGDKKNANIMILDFTYHQEIQSITFFFMKSYGSKWLNSELEAKIWSSKHQLLEERSMLGTHGKNTSEMYTEEIFLSKPLDAGEKFQLEAKLVGGETFKIMGLAVCS